MAPGFFVEDVKSEFILLQLNLILITKTVFFWI